MTGQRDRGEGSSSRPEEHVNDPQGRRFKCGKCKKLKDRNQFSQSRMKKYRSVFYREEKARRPTDCIEILCQTCGHAQHLAQTQHSRKCIKCSEVKPLTDDFWGSRARSAHQQNLTCLECLRKRDIRQREGDSDTDSEEEMTLIEPDADGSGNDTSTLPVYIPDDLDDSEEDRPARIIEHGDEEAAMEARRRLKAFADLERMPAAERFKRLADEAYARMLKLKPRRVKRLEQVRPSWQPPVDESVTYNPRRPVQTDAQPVPPPRDPDADLPNDLARTKVADYRDGPVLSRHERQPTRVDAEHHNQDVSCLLGECNYEEESDDDSPLDEDELLIKFEQINFEEDDASDIFLASHTIADIKRGAIANEANIHLRRTFADLFVAEEPADTWEMGPIQVNGTARPSRFNTAQTTLGGALMLTTLKNLGFTRPEQPFQILNWANPPRRIYSRRTGTITEVPAKPKKEEDVDDDGSEMEIDELDLEIDELTSEYG